MGEVRFGEAICRDFTLSASREWLETNGLGGFASSTLPGMNTRRYHGLLVAALQPPVGRMVLLSKLEEALTFNGETRSISTNCYPGAVHPDGHRYLKEFRLDPFPVFVYSIGACEIEKSIFMVNGENTTVVQYELRGEPEFCFLDLRPLIAFRDYHSLTHENDALSPAFQTEDCCLALAPYAGLPRLFVWHGGGTVRASGNWYRNFEYEVERSRGLDFREDLFNPCSLSIELRKGERQALIASTEMHAIKDGVNSFADRLRESEIERRAKIKLVRSAPAAIETLARAADQFIVRRGPERRTVIAGYHWFTDWGRDTMISLPGLTLAAGRPELAKEILLTYADHVDQGMLPNRFADAGGDPEYNTVDATLWFFEAARAYLEHTGDVEFITGLYPALENIIAWHQRGTRFGIRVDDDGLLTAGERLTWMDAAVDGRAVTPRQGKAVEIQALWYNALRIMEDFAARCDSRQTGRYQTLAAQASRSFLAKFRNPAAQCLYDAVDTGETGHPKDASIRPNQVFAVSLHHSMLNAEQAIEVVSVIERELLTPFGLRTLSPSDPAYRGRFEGDPRSRDSAYHQGTVWPWLMGPFIAAYLRVNGGSMEARQQAARWLAPLAGWMHNEGAGQIPEVFDGDAPHRAGGCIAQAWSVGELLRVWADVTSIPDAQEDSQNRSRTVSDLLR